MTTNNVTKYLKFANVQMAAESLFGFRDPSIIPVGERNTKGQSQIVLRGAHMNEKSDSMEKKSTPTPGALNEKGDSMEKKSTPTPGARSAPLVPALPTIYTFTTWSVRGFAP